MRDESPCARAGRSTVFCPAQMLNDAGKLTMGLGSGKTTRLSVALQPRLSVAEQEMRRLSCTFISSAGPVLPFDHRKSTGPFEVWAWARISPPEREGKPGSGYLGHFPTDIASSGSRISLPGKRCQWHKLLFCQEGSLGEEGAY